MNKTYCQRGFGNISTHWQDVTGSTPRIRVQVGADARSRFKDSFVFNQTRAFQIKFRGKSPALRVAANRKL
jgi:hypothetical protein